MDADSTPYVPPRYTIDLSLPPQDRYRSLALAYRDRVQDLTGLFDALLLDLAVPQRWLPTVNQLSKLVLRRVYDSVQTRELKGISEVTQVPMYLLVAFNVILDLLMGCSSGGARTLEKGQPAHTAKMLHFRTLDWSMDPLRRVIVQLDFVKSKSPEPQRILATTITYVGFVGVLTGVRQGLSMSLNFRAVHDAGSRVEHFRFYLHHLLVLLGRRPSIATILRTYLFHESANQNPSPGTGNRKSSLRSAKGSFTAPSLPTLYDKLKSVHTTAAYLIFSDGTSTMCIEKDFKTATMRTSNDFIAVTNHDVDEHPRGKEPVPLADKTATDSVRGLAGLEELFDESKERLECLNRRWERKVMKGNRQRTKPGDNNISNTASNVRFMLPEELKELVTKYPTTNESTHFAAIMDPQAGTITWALAYPTQDSTQITTLD